MRATFEEKTYENYFNSELGSVTQIYFPLGQVQEGSLGFDSSALLRNRGLWRRLGYPFWFFPHFRGVLLREIADEMEAFLGVVINELPKMKANLLFQYKKPEFMINSRGREWINWNMPYYRYNIYQEQQNLLMNIDNKFGDNVFVVYASPAIHDVNELVNAYLNKQIINSSNFCKASELNGHHRNTYIESGRYSIACSAPKRIENLDFLDSINQLSDMKSDYGNNYEFITNFSKQIISIVSESVYYAESFNKLNEQYSNYQRHSLLYSHLVLQNLKLLTGIQWLVKV